MILSSVWNFTQLDRLATTTCKSNKNQYALLTANTFRVFFFLSPRIHGYNTYVFLTKHDPMIKILQTI